MKIRLFMIILMILVLLAIGYAFNSKISSAQEKTAQDKQAIVEEKLDKILANQGDIISRLQVLDRLVRTRKVD